MRSCGVSFLPRVGRRALWATAGERLGQFGADLATLIVAASSCGSVRPGVDCSTVTIDNPGFWRPKWSDGGKA